MTPCRSCASCERELSAVRLELQAVVRERDQHRDALEQIAENNCRYCSCVEPMTDIARAALGGTE